MGLWSLRCSQVGHEDVDELLLRLSYLRSFLVGDYQRELLRHLRRKVSPERRAAELAVPALAAHAPRYLDVGRVVAA